MRIYSLGVTQFIIFASKSTCRKVQIFRNGWVTCANHTSPCYRLSEYECDWHLRSHRSRRCLSKMSWSLSAIAPVTFSFHHTALMPPRNYVNPFRTHPVRKIAINGTLCGSTDVTILANGQRIARWGELKRLHIFLLQITLVLETRMFFRSDPKEPGKCSVTTVCRPSYRSDRRSYAREM